MTYAIAAALRDVLGEMWTCTATIIDNGRSWELEVYCADCADTTHLTTLADAIVYLHEHVSFIRREAGHATT